jgi:hypothetical protein
MAYGPAVLERMSRTYTLLHDSLINKGVNVWYGEAGDDVELARMMLDDSVDFATLKQYLLDNYMEDEEDDE